MKLWTDSWESRLNSCFAISTSFYQIETGLILLWIKFITRLEEIKCSCFSIPIILHYSNDKSGMVLGLLFWELLNKITKDKICSTSMLQRKARTKFSISLYFGLHDVRGSPPEVFLSKGVLKICSKFTWEHHSAVRFQ